MPTVRHEFRTNVYDGFLSSPEILQAIADVCGESFTPPDDDGDSAFYRLWADPTEAETERVESLAWSYASPDDDTLHWGQTTLRRKPFLLEGCAHDMVTALDLQREMAEAERNGTRYATYFIVPLNSEGYRESVCGYLLWYPDDMRAGIAYGADADWTDANSPDHALAMWRAGTMVP